MTWQSIAKSPAAFAVAPNLDDYAAARASFSWAAARSGLDGLPGGGLNIAHEAVDRHAAGARADHVALRWLARDGGVHDTSYGELKLASDRFANVLAGLGLGQDDRVFALIGRVPALYAAVLGTFKQRCVFSPLFSAFGPEPIRARMSIGQGRLLLTTEALYRRKVRDQRDRLPDLEHIVLVGPASAEILAEPGVHAFDALMAAADDAFTIPPTAPDDMALLHFTSGTTGKPKAAIHVHEAVLAHYVTAGYALDLQGDDIFWCTADPGWVTGMSYGIIAPLAHGVTMIVDEQEFEAERWYRVLAEQAVTVWYTAPTAVRMMMRQGADAKQRHDLSHLRFVASVGEPLNPEAVLWGQRALGLPIHDNWWQTETGGIMIANFAATEIRPGSMGLPLPGIEAAIVARDEAGAVHVIDEPGRQGELALKPGWPSMFRGYLGEDERYHRCFADGWYLSGDLATRDADGYYWFVGRADDVIKTSGHMVGPFEVESALMEHPAVAEVGVIGKPDPTAGELVKAFVALKPGHDGDDTLRRELMALARKRLGAAVAPKEIEFKADLPRTRSGKIMRRLLKARELGLPEGDTSTLERPA